MVATCFLRIARWCCLDSARAAPAQPFLKVTSRTPSATLSSATDDCFSRSQLDEVSILQMKFDEFWGSSRMVLGARMDRIRKFICKSIGVIGLDVNCFFSDQRIIRRFITPALLPLHDVKQLAFIVPHAERQCATQECHSF
jgi:hypothetical protein